MLCENIELKLCDNFNSRKWRVNCYMLHN